MLLPGCKQKPAATKPPATQPRVASLVPAATDLIIGMGAAEHLVAVSTYDIKRPDTINLPQVGAYQDLDWEQIALAKPDVMIVFMAPDRMPEAMRQRAQQMQLRLVNVRTERLEDIFTELANLGEILHEQPKAATTAAALRKQLDATRQRASAAPKIRTLIAREQTADAVVGRGNFINDALEIAGGINVVETVGWPTIDREKLLSLKPQVIFHLLPGASPQVVAEAEQIWQTMPQIPAVADKRVYILTEWWVQQPGMHVPDLADRFANLLHPPATRPASTKASP